MEGFADVRGRKLRVCPMKCAWYQGRWQVSGFWLYRAEDCPLSRLYAVVYRGCAVSTASCLETPIGDLVIDQVLGLAMLLTRTGYPYREC